MTIALGLLTLASPGGAAPPGDPVTGTASVFLVRAVARDLQEGREGNRTVITARHKIVLVYCGPADLLGQSFTSRSPLDGVDFHGYSIDPPPVPGEAGIWALNRLATGIRYLNRYPFPAREKVTPWFNQAQLLAETMEQCCHADADGRVTLLREAVASRVPEVARWAVDALAEAHPQALLEFAREARLEDLAIAAQTALDRALSKLRGKAWMDSPQRLRLLDGWVRAALSDHEADDMIGRLDVVAQHAELDGRELLGLLDTAIRNPRLPAETRRRAVWVIGIICRRDRASTDAAFAALTAMVRGSDDRQIRVAAAGRISYFVALDEDRIATVRTLVEEVVDQELRDLLQEALKRGASGPLPSGPILR